MEDASAPVTVLLVWPPAVFPLPKPKPKGPKDMVGRTAAPA